MTRDGSSSPVLVRHACAKVNLDLRVGAMGPDGFHPLDTVFQTLALHDTLRFEPTGGDLPLAITCDDPAVPTDGRNLVWRAAAVLWLALGRDGEPRGVRVDIRKAIPAQGGLGGGSSDAAVALVALHALWGGPLGRDEIVALAGRVGADVPFFLVGGTARGAGRGEQLEAWPDLPRFEVVLAVPAFGVPTADAYRWFDESAPGDALWAGEGGHVLPREARQSRLIRPIPGEGGAPRVQSRPSGEPEATMQHVRGWLVECRNDLEPAVVARHPVIREIRRELASSGAVHALMSGSGSTVFGLFERADAADAAARALTAAGVATCRSQTLARAEYVRQAFGLGTAAALPRA